MSTWRTYIVVMRFRWWFLVTFCEYQLVDNCADSECLRAGSER
jgi:hypothetical protein